MAATIQETIEQLHTSLRDYIEATYHIGDATLISQRLTLLKRTGVTHHFPYLESTPSYQFGQNIAMLEGPPPAALAVHSALATFHG